MTILEHDHRAPLARGRKTERRVVVTATKATVTARGRRRKLCERDTLLERIATLPLDDERKENLARTVASDLASPKAP